MINFASAKIIAFGIISVACIVFLGLWRMEVKDHRLTNVSLAAAEATISLHEQNIATSERINREHQADIDRLNANVKRMRSKPARCIPISFKAGLHADGQQGGGHAGKDGQSIGLSSEWLYDYAAEAERYRVERNICIDYANSVQKRGTE